MTTESQSLLITGASARAAAFSAVRAGFVPYWIDEFGDADLAESFIGVKVPPDDYPGGIPQAARSLPAMPFLYTGAMENHLNVIDALSRDRELLGNDSGVCRPVRDPFLLRDCLRDAGLAFATVAMKSSGNEAGWLCKSWSSSGGLGIHFHNGNGAVPAGHYLQAFIQGRSVSAVYIGDGRGAQLAGVTRQLVGKAAFHAARFSYCGSIGPLPLTETEKEEWQCIGDTLAGTFGLRGLFGVDAIQRDEGITPLEVNPRYTASVEVVEAGTGLALIGCHVEACRGRLRMSESKNNGLHGKCYLFAPRRLHVTGDLRAAPMPCELDSVTLADVPVPGTVIESGAPILSLHTSGRDQLDCLQRLSGKAAAIIEKLQVISHK
ncbi:MAG: ATP-grasp domain-containing protein [Gammaproteobacteria bacterium]